jgi:pimeloyl-ACP methyl ester carboxylesterase
MAEISHRFVETNRVKLHIAEAGSGPLVLMAHGWPESWYSWRHQLPALADAGYHAVAPDQRGYGQSDRPEAVEEYDVFRLVGDLVGLVQAFGKESAVLVGHDWGAILTWYAALLRPDVFPAVAVLSVPYLPRGPVKPTDNFRALAGEREFYILRFQQPGRPEAEVDAHARRFLTGVLYSASGDAKPGEEWKFLFPMNETLLDTGVVPDKLPAWLKQEDLDYFVAEFERTGFGGGFNWYRNFDRNWEQTPFLDGALVRQPALFMIGDRDPVYQMTGGAVDAMTQSVPGLTASIVLKGCGHWTQQERPDEVNQALLGFLAQVAPV